MSEPQPQHALYSASGSHKWMSCAGAIAMEQGLPDSSSAYADEGSAAHFVGAECLQFDHDPFDFVGRTVVCWRDDTGRSTQTFSEVAGPDGAEETSRWDVTRDMAENLTVYVNTVREAAKKGTLFVEYRLNFGELIGAPGQFGTSDAFVIYHDGSQVDNFDLKYGYNQVEATSTQLRLYDLGILNDFKDQIDPSKLQQFRNVIVQPRIGNISEDILPINDLIAFADEAKAAIERSEEARVFFKTPNDIYETDREWQDEYLNPTDKGCQWCKAKRGGNGRGICPAFERVALVDMDIPAATAEGLTDLDEQLDHAIEAAYNLPFERIAKLYAATDKLEQLIDVVKTRMFHDLMTGYKHPDYKIVKGRDGNRKWKDEAAAEEILKASKKLKVDQIYDRKLISPTSAEKLIKKDFPRVWNKLEQLVTRSEGNLLVAPRSDKHEALDPYGDALSALPNLTVEDVKKSAMKLLEMDGGTPIVSDEEMAKMIPQPEEAVTAEPSWEDLL